MKYVVFVLALAAVPFAGRWLAERKHLIPALYTLIPFLIFYGLDSLDINVISREDYRGDSRGIEVTIVDLIVGAIGLAIGAGPRSIPYKLPIFAFYACVVLSAFLAPVGLYASFSVWKLTRMIVLLAVTAKAAEDPRVPPAILRGLALGLLWELLLCIQQRYLHHVHQTPGNLGHQNTVGMAVNLVLPAFFAMLLEQHGGRLGWAALGGGLFLVILTLSRGAMTMVVLGLGLVYGMSVARRLSGRKLGVALGGVVAGLVGLAQAWDSIVDRFLHAPRESAEGRELFEIAASRMLHDHPLGVGINLFSHVLDHGGYGRGVHLPLYDRSGIVHNVYWLTAAEVGYAGFVAFVLVLAAPLVLAFVTGLRGARDIRRDVLTGLGTGLLVLFAQGTLEWASRQTTLSYLFWLVAGTIAALARSLRTR